MIITLQRATGTVVIRTVTPDQKKRALQIGFGFHRNGTRRFLFDVLVVFSRSFPRQIRIVQRFRFVRFAKY